MGILQARILEWVAMASSRLCICAFVHIHLYEIESCPVMSDSLWSQGLHSPWNSPGQNTGVGSVSILQGIFPNQGSNPGLLHCRQILYQLSHKGSPYICISTYKYTNYLHTNIHTHTHLYVYTPTHIHICYRFCFSGLLTKKNHSLEVENDVLFSGLFLRT